MTMRRMVCRWQWRSRRRCVRRQRSRNIIRCCTGGQISGKGRGKMLFGKRKGKKHMTRHPMAGTDALSGRRWRSGIRRTNTVDIRQTGCRPGGWHLSSAKRMKGMYSGRWNCSRKWKKKDTHLYSQLQTRKLAVTGAGLGGGAAVF